MVCERGPHVACACARRAVHAPQASSPTRRPRAARARKASPTTIATKSPPVRATCGLSPARHGPTPACPSPRPPLARRRSPPRDVCRPAPASRSTSPCSPRLIGAAGDALAKAAQDKSNLRGIAAQQAIASGSIPTWTHGYCTICKAWKGSSSSTVITAKCEKGHAVKRLQTRGPFPVEPPAGWHVGSGVTGAQM